MGVYGEDLAFIHDAGFGGFADEAAPSLLELLAGAGINRGLVVDLGCGTGRWASRLRGAGYEVLGIDVSAAMLALARRRAPDASFLEGSLFEVPLPACEAVTALGECLAYAGEPRRPPLPRLFRRIYASLRPGGVLIFDLLEPGSPPARSRQKHWHGEDWALLLEAQPRDGGRVLERRITAFRAVGGRYRRSEELHRVHLFPRGDVARLLRRTGFRVRHLRGYGATPFPRGRAGFLARKP